MSSLNLNKYANLAEYYADTRPVGEHNVSYIGNEYVIYDDEEMYDMQGNKIINWQNYLNFYMPDGGTISLNKTGSPTVVELEYSLNKGQTWTVWQPDNNGNRSLVLTSGQRMYVRNTSEAQTGFSTSTSAYYQFVFTDNVEAHGNINSLLCKIPNVVTALSAYCYHAIFRDCQIVTAPELPATVLANYCYRAMFEGCNYLVICPELPATALACGCYRSMFGYCNSLVASPELNATVLAEECYRRMFSSCTSLNKLRTQMTDISATNCLTNWLNNVSLNGDFYCPAELTIPTGDSGIPSGWTRHDI